MNKKTFNDLIEDYASARVSWREALIRFAGARLDSAIAIPFQEKAQATEEKKPE